MKEGKGSKGSKMGWREGKGAREVKWDGAREGEQGFHKKEEGKGSKGTQEGRREGEQGYTRRKQGGVKDTVITSTKPHL